MTIEQIKELIEKHHGLIDQVAGSMRSITVPAVAFDPGYVTHRVLPYTRPTLESWVGHAMRSTVLAIVQEILPELEHAVREDVKQRLIRSM